MAGRWGSLIGQKFNMLTITDFKGVQNGVRIWEAKCDCGNNRLISTGSLRKTRSCGCLSKNHFNDLTGKSFNDNTAILYIGKNKQHSHMYHFKCKCGIIFEAEGNDIKSGKIKSCGCKWNSDQKIYAKREETIHNTIYAQYRKAAITRGFSFNLSKEQVRILTAQPCHYCNIENSNMKKDNADAFVRYNGIDRKDNKLGYEITNVVTACKHCNQAKHTMSEKFFKEFLNRIFKAKEEKHGFWKDEENNG